MEDRETPRMHKYGASKTTRIMMASVCHVTAWAGRTKYQADGFLFDGAYIVFAGDVIGVGGEAGWYVALCLL